VFGGYSSPSPGELSICLDLPVASHQIHPISTPFRSGQAVRFALLRARSLDRLGRYGGGHPQPIEQLGGDVLVVFASVLVPMGTFCITRPDTPASLGRPTRRWTDRSRHKPRGSDPA
jgi:hypothetical protein